MDRHANDNHRVRLQADEHALTACAERETSAARGASTLIPLVTVPRHVGRHPTANDFGSHALIVNTAESARKCE